MGMAAYLKHDVHALGRRQALILRAAEGVCARLHAPVKPNKRHFCHPPRRLSALTLDRLTHGRGRPPGRRASKRKQWPHQHDVQEHAAGPHVGGLGVVRLALGGEDDLWRQVRRRAHPRTRRALEVLVLQQTQCNDQMSPVWARWHASVPTRDDGALGKFSWCRNTKMAAQNLHI